MFAVFDCWNKESSAKSDVDEVNHTKINIFFIETVININTLRENETFS